MTKLTNEQEAHLRERADRPEPGLWANQAVGDLLDTLSWARSPEGLYAMLRHEQHSRCAYLTRDGDGRVCDCKFGLGSLTLRPRGEMTGCPELRTALAALRGLYPNLREPGQDAVLRGLEEG